MTARLRLVLLVLVILGGLVSATAAAQEPMSASCATIVPAGGDVTGAIYAAPAGATVCLAPGVHRPFVVDGTAPAGITLRGVIAGIAAVVAEQGDAAQVLGAVRFTIADLTLRGGRPSGLYVRGASDLTLRNIRVESATHAIHLDEGTTARLTGVTITRSAETGLLVRRRAHVVGERVRVPDASGTGIAVLGGAGRVTLRDSEVGPTPAPALFAGVPGCGNLVAATLAVPRCFLDDPDAYISEVRVELDGLAVRDGPGPGLVFYPGAIVSVRNASVTGRRLSGLFAWGAHVDVADSEFDGNVVQAIEYRAYPDPRGEVRRVATGSVMATTVRGTLPLGGPLLGDGIIARGARLAVRRSRVTANAGAGIAFMNGSSGEIVANTVVGNGGAGICFGADAGVVEFDNNLAENGIDAVDRCPAPDTAVPLAE